jgi:hypothetical protein
VAVYLRLAVTGVALVKGHILNEDRIDSGHHGSALRPRTFVGAFSNAPVAMRWRPNSGSPKGRV